MSLCKDFVAQFLCEKGQMNQHLSIYYRNDLSLRDIIIFQLRVGLEH